MLRSTALAIIVCALLFSSAGSAADESAGPAIVGKRVALVEINGVIDPNMARYYKRALADARAAKVDAVVVHMTTPGGRVDSAEEMSKTALANAR